MSRGQSYFITLIRNRTRQNYPDTQIRSLTVESRDNESKSEDQKSTGDGTSSALSYKEMAKTNNVLFSMWFFRWLCSNYDGYTPDPVSLNLLFGALLDANAVKAATSFLDTTRFNPEPELLEPYVKCLCKEGLVGEGCLKARKETRLFVETSPRNGRV
ncbi:unnamed protein product [Arabis nemorensis]|uniref:Pentatricopeptide repeat-containing protein n=1 Tax=Arabis nemorensis TaxID=586526 RepID=A0A565CN10_9BRAS|nr:unnamed protein product [Arabis nemorensis]